MYNYWEEKRYGLVSRYDQSAWTANQGRRNRGEWRGTAPAFWNWRNGAHVPLHNSTICNFMIYQDRLGKNLLQLFAHTNSEGFSIISVIIFKVNMLLDM